MTSYTPNAVDRDAVYDLMAQHTKLSQEANEVHFQRMFEIEAQAETAQLELDLATKANRLAFDIADMFMTDEFKAGFQDYWKATLADSEK
jgi:hypothetical protein